MDGLLGPTQPRHTPATLAQPGNLSEKRSLGPHSKPTETQAAFKQDPQVMCTYITAWEALLLTPPSDLCATTQEYPTEAAHAAFCLFPTTGSPNRFSDQNRPEGQNRPEVKKGSPGGGNLPGRSQNSNNTALLTRTADHTHPGPCHPLKPPMGQQVHRTACQHPA